MAISQNQVYTEDDYYSIPEDVWAELIDGQIYYQAAPSRVQVYPAPFAVKLREDRETIVEPDISVICDQNKLTGGDVLVRLDY